LNRVQEGAAEFANKFSGQAKEDLRAIKNLVSASGTKLGELLGEIQVYFK